MKTPSSSADTNSHSAILTPHSSSGSPDITRRMFLARASTAAAGLTLVAPHLVSGAEANAKINIGIVGCGGRGAWVSDLFAKDGRYNIVAVADYFQDRVDEVGQKLNVPANKRFTGLSGYKRLLEEKIDAVAIETPPYFHPEQIAAAVDAGKHVYTAKPLAVDVPGCLSIADSAKKATGKKLAMLVDFQTRAMPAYQEILKRTRAGELGKLVSIFAEYQTNIMFQERDAQLRKDPKNPEIRLRTWGIDKVISGDVITEQNIHALDVATWFADADPIKAYGHGGRSRPFLGDCWDHYSVLFFFPDDLVVTFCAKQVGWGFDDIMVRAHGMNGTAETNYGGKCWITSRDDKFNGTTPNIYQTGVEINIASFYDAITKGDYANATVAPSVRSNLTTILGRTAAYKKTEVTWAQMMKANEKWVFDTKGLKS